MQKRQLGNTGLCVSELCFGVLPMGPSQLGLSPQEGGRLIADAVLRGVNYLDTAQTYGTYPHIKAAFDLLGERSSHVIVSTKSAATDYQGMKEAFEEARLALGRDVIDLMFLHAARVKSTVFEDRKGALDCLVDLKSRGLIKGIGISTHSVTVARRAVSIPEIDVIFPIINKSGLGILEGTKEEMETVISYASCAGKGVVAMKALGGGNLIGDVEGAIDYVRNLSGVTTVAVGMVQNDELLMNLDIFEGRKVMRGDERGNRPNSLTIQSFCIGCGSCVDVCPNHAMTIVDGKAVNLRDRCILCGYCAPVCPQFAIRIV